MGDSLNLDDMLNDRWLEELSGTISLQPGVEEILSRGRSSSTYPIRELTFRSLIHHDDPSKWRVVIFGQSPYPRIESATGIGCCDGKITSWDQALSPTLRNVIKNALVGEGHLRRDDKVGAVRSKLRELDVVQPADWFQRTIEEGVLWLNASLTLNKEDPVSKHAKFWAPIVEKIVDVVITAKSTLREGHNDRALVVVLWGGFAKKLWKMVQRVNRGRIPICSVEAHNPAVETFQEKLSFRKINESLVTLGSDTINFLPSVNYAMMRYSLRRGEEAQAETTVEEATEVLRAATRPGLRARLAATTAMTAEAGDPFEDGEGSNNDDAGRRPWKRLRKMKRIVCEEAEDGEGACVVCLTNKINSVLLSCGHLACCMDCGKKLDRCPMCRSSIWKVVRTYSAH